MPIKKRYLVIDSGIFEKAADWPSTSCQSSNELDERAKASNFLSKIQHECHHIILDDVGEILKEYRKKTKRSRYANAWFEKLRKYMPDKINLRSRTPLNLKCRIDPADLKFFEVAVKSPHRIYVTTEKKHRQLRELEEIKNLELKILNIDEALEELQKETF